jgi:DNA-binding XRE family transcriptional regulator
MTSEQEKFYQVVGLRIRDARKAAGLKQDALASYLDLSRASIVNIEKGRQHPSLFLLTTIAKILNTQPTAFIPEIAIPEIKSKASWQKLIGEKLQGDKATEEKILSFLNDLNREK